MIHFFLDDVAAAQSIFIKHGNSVKFLSERHSTAGLPLQGVHIALFCGTCNVFLV